MSVIRSMTGFARVTGSVNAELPFTLTLKSVNHRFLDLHLRLPSGSEAVEAILRRRLKEQIQRGHVEVTLVVEHAAEAKPRLNEEVLGEYVRLFRELSARHGIALNLDLPSLLRLPGVMGGDTAGPLRGGDMAGAEAAILDACDRAITLLQEDRAEEGAVLGQALRRGMDAVLRLAQCVAGLREEMRPTLLERVRQRVGELAGVGELAEERLLAEVAMLVERSDVEEELVRLRTHAERFLVLLEEGGELGKRTDFLLQELNREANTLLAKTSGAAGLAITEVGLEMKAEIERAREQVQNLE